MRLFSCLGSSNISNILKNLKVGGGANKMGGHQKRAKNSNCWYFSLQNRQNLGENAKVGGGDNKPDFGHFWRQIGKMTPDD